MNEERLREEVITENTDTETPVSVQVFEEEQTEDEDYYTANSERKRQFISAQMEKRCETQTKKKRRTLFGVVANFIYHHKFISVLLGICIIAGLGFGIYKLCQKSYDYNIGIYTYDSEFTDAQTEKIEALFHTYGKDLDGDGKITVRVTTYHPMDDNEVIGFSHDQKLRRDVYGDAKHGDRVNDIIITDETVRDMIFMCFGTLFFDEICDEGIWAATDCGELLGEDYSGQGQLGFMVFACNYYDSDLQSAKADNKAAREVFAAISENCPELFDISDTE